MENSFGGLSKLGGAIPVTHPTVHGVERIRNIRYSEDGLGEHVLDVYRPRGASNRPVVLYAHGGGFRSLSKDTHWLMGLAFARRGFVVFNVNYRLAPRHPFPSALEDVCQAYHFMLDSAKDYGGDPSRVVLSGESAGANLVSALTVALTYEREEDYARRVFERGLVPKAVAPMCGMLQVSDPQRFARMARIPKYLQWTLSPAYISSEDYLRGTEPNGSGYGLADPLVIFESEAKPSRPLPSMFAGVGTWDPIQDDTRRLAAAVRRHGANCVDRYYARETHAFHALIFRRRARQCWRDLFQFLRDEGL